jgi:hypothetical protein
LLVINELHEFFGLHDAILNGIFGVMPTKPKHKQRLLNPHIFLTREELGARWDLSQETLRRREAEGILTPLRLPGGKRGQVRYRLEDIERIEHEALVRRPFALSTNRQPRRRRVMEEVES